MPLEGGRYREADGFYRAARIRYDEVGGQGIEAAFNALHGGVERLQVYCDIGSVFSWHLWRSSSYRCYRPSADCERLPLAAANTLYLLP